MSLIYIGDFKIFWKGDLLMLIQNTEIVKHYDENDVLLDTTETSKIVNFKKSNEEGKYIKIYEEGLEKLVSLSANALLLLFELCKEMSYADIKDKAGGQIVRINKSIREDIQDRLGIKKRAFYSLLAILKDNNIIRSFGNGDYQINPNIIGKGLFEYNPRFKYGGIKDLRETFSQDKVSNTAIEYDIPLIKEQLEIELEKIRNEYDTSNDREYRKYLAKMINDFQYEIKKLNDTEYTKKIKYSDIQDLQERIQEVVDDINEE